MWIQNAFVPYSTAWDANHEYMYIPKILAENAGIYRWNTIANNMPWFWHQFLTFIFSLTGCTNWWLWLSPDNIAISMNNISAVLVLIFWIAIIFQIFTLIDNKQNEDEKENSLKKWKKTITESETSNWNWITIWRYFILLRLTSWMGAFLVIVDNKTDLWVMALSLLALLAGLIFLQNRRDSNDKKEILKYIIIAWLFFGFAALAKITAFVDLVLFWLLLVWVRFSSLTSLWLWIMAMWLVRKFNILTSSVMITDENATWFIIIGWVITIIWLVISILKWKELWRKLRDLIILWICFLVPLILFKLPWTTISQIDTNNYSIWNSLKAVFLSKLTEQKYTNEKKLLAQNSWINPVFYNTISDQVNDENSISWTKEFQKSFSQCSKIGNIYSEDELNENLEEIVGWQWWEDFWRYIWYWWKEFNETNTFNTDEHTAQQILFKIFKTIWPKSKKCNWINNNWNTICEKNLIFWLMKKIWPTSNTCYWFNHDAKILCNNSSIIDNFKIDDLRWIYESWINNKSWEAWVLLKEAIDAYDKAKSEWKINFWTNNSSLFHDEIVNLRQYYQSHSISSTSWSIYIPYRYLVPLNISFNWSLQNLSSYYTDTGFIWIIIYLLILTALPYAIIKKDKVLTAITLTTIIGRWIRRIIWSAILRYWTVLISWSAITLAIFWNKILQKDNNIKIIPLILIIVIWIFFWIQLIFNFLRIASQWANSIFVWYKWNVGNERAIDENLRQSENPKIIYWYTKKDVFNLQFAQYNPIINALSERKNEDWVIIAWTYIQYFLGNHRNVKSDWMLSEFWKKTSDWDLCKTYRRLKNDNTSYIIIDPNIGTVTMWEWNETLFYRFFGKLNNNKTKIELDWAITTLIRLAKNWYLELLNTNNIGAKYAFTIDDDTIKNNFWGYLTDEELILIRGKMAVLQYFNDAEQLFWAISNIFISRVLNNPELWIEDIANIYWFEINSKNVSNVAVKYINGKWTKDDVKNLNQNERSVLINYLNLYNTYLNNQSNARSMVQNLLVNSVSWWSQIIALKLK